MVATGMFLAGISIGAAIGYFGRVLDEQQRRRNGWDKG